MGKREETLGVLSGVKEIPTVSVKLIEMLQDPDARTEEIVKLIEFDPAFTAHILRIANSVYFGGLSWIQSVREAVLRLGQRFLLQTAMTMLMTSVAKRFRADYDLPAEDLWKHSVAVAICTEAIAERMGKSNTDFFFTAGLLHDVGKFIFGSRKELGVERVLSACRQNGISLVDAETEILGLDHAEAGAFVLNMWNIPNFISEGIMYHHYPWDFPKNQMMGDNQISEFILLADEITYRERIVEKESYSESSGFGELIEKYKLEDSDIAEVVARVRERMEETLSIFQG